MEAGLRMHDGRVIKGMTIPRQLILVIAISATILGSALGKSPKPSTGGQSPSNQTIQLAAPDQRGTDQVPLIVKVLPAQKSQSETEKEECDQKAKAEVDAKSAFETQRIADYTWWLSGVYFDAFLYRHCASWIVCLAIAAHSRKPDRRKDCCRCCEGWGQGR